MTVLRFMLVAAAFVLASCGKGEEAQSVAAPVLLDVAGKPVPVESFGKQDGECFAGIVRAADAKKFSKDDFSKWKDKLGGKDKDWLNNFSVYHSYVTRILTTNMGKTTKELSDAKLLDQRQVDVIDGYLAVAQESDVAKADSMAAGACTAIGFSKGINFN